VTDVPPPESPKPPRGRPRRPRGYDDEALLSEEEVARRVDVRGGGAPRGPIERAPVRAPRTPARRPERTGARDSLLLIGLVIVGLVAVRLFLPEGPLTANATATPGGTQAAVVTTVPTAGPVVVPPTGVLITLPPTPFVPTASPGQITEPPITPVPVPTPTLKPGQTPAPTPRPTRTPTPTTGPTPPGTATISVTFLVIKDDGGSAVAGDWTVNATSGGTATPSSFPGSGSATVVTVTAGQSYNIAPGAGPSGYSTTRSSGCSSTTAGNPSAGTSRTCQISKNDIKPTLTVYTIVDGGSQSPSDWTVTVTGTDVVPSSFSGSSGGVEVALNAGSFFSVDQTNGSATDYTGGSSGTCSGDSLSVGANVTCTFTFTYVPPPTPVGVLPVVLPVAPLLFLVPRRWRSTRAA
jgi:outer membrane biosynthesis protein TonB